MKTANIYHATDAIFTDTLFYGKSSFVDKEGVSDFWATGGYQRAGSVTFDDDVEVLDKVFTATQNDAEDPNWIRSAPTRSTSVGDIVEVDGVFYVVASMGFDQIELEPFED